jgi:hypothetical protein
VDLHLQFIHAHEHTAIHTLINALVNQFYSIQGHIVILFLWVLFSSWSLRTCILWCSPFWRIMGPRITQMLYIVVYCFPFQLTDQYFQIRSLYVTSNLMLKGFLSKNLEQCVFLSKWWVSSLGDIFSGNTPYFHGLLHSSFHSSFPGQYEINRNPNLID